MPLNSFAKLFWAIIDSFASIGGKPKPDLEGNGDTADISAEIPPDEPSQATICLTVKAYSELYGVPKSTVRSWIKKGKLETAEKILGRTMVKDNRGTPRKVNGKWIFEGKDAADEQAVSDDQAV